MSTKGKTGAGNVLELRILPAPEAPKKMPKSTEDLSAIIESARGRIQEQYANKPETAAADRAAALSAEIMEDLGIGGLRSPIIEALVNAVIELTGRNIALRESNSALAEESRTDPLTGLLNRRGFQEQMGRHVALDRRRDLHDREAQKRHPYVVIAVDIEHFKRTNDTHGHLAADEVLKQVAGTMKANVRSTDLVVRLGGEEFALVLLDTDIGNAKNIAEKVRQAVEEKTKLEGAKIPTTISLGIAGYNGTDLDTVLERADKAMYESKDAGRNRVTIAPESVPV